MSGGFALCERSTPAASQTWCSFSFASTRLASPLQLTNAGLYPRSNGNVFLTGTFVGTQPSHGPQEIYHPVAEPDAAVAARRRCGRWRRRAGRRATC